MLNPIKMFFLHEEMSESLQDDIFLYLNEIISTLQIKKLVFIWKIFNKGHYYLLVYFDGLYWTLSQLLLHV